MLIIMRETDTSGSTIIRRIGSLKALAAATLQGEGRTWDDMPRIVSTGQLPPDARPVVVPIGERSPTPQTQPDPPPTAA
jgi:hypothetical protein